jgi:hypothetical protein
MSLGRPKYVPKGWAMKVLMLAIVIIYCPSIEAHALELSELGRAPAGMMEISTAVKQEGEHRKIKPARAIGLIGTEDRSIKNGPAAAWGGGIRKLFGRCSFIYSNLRTESGSNRNEMKLGANYHFHFE